MSLDLSLKINIFLCYVRDSVTYGTLLLQMCITKNYEELSFYIFHHIKSPTGAYDTKKINAISYLFISSFIQRYILLSTEAHSVLQYLI